MSTPEACDTDPGEEIDCWNCEDTGWYVTVGYIRMPCPDCKLGDVNFYHERDAFRAQMVHVDDGLGEQAEDELEAWERSRDK